MIETPPGYSVSTKYGSFPVNREVLVVLQAVVGGSFPDYSDNVKWQLRLRFAPYPLAHPTVFDFDQAMTKLVGRAVAGDTAKAQVSVRLPTVRDALHVEWVAVELDVVQAGTPSGKREHALDQPWIAVAIDSPTS